MSRKRLKLNGRVAAATESSVLLKLRPAPPAATLASTKLYPLPARLVLDVADVIVNVGPVTNWPKIEIVIGPLAAPKGTIAVIALAVALTTRADTPLKRTSMFWVRVSKWTPWIVTVVAGGPLSGVTCVIVGRSDR